MLRTLVLAIAILLPSAALAAPVGPASAGGAGIHQTMRVQMKVMPATNKARFILFSRLSPAKGAEVQEGDILF